MKVLVTGATGFLGEHVVRLLVEAGTFDVRTFARSTSPILAELGVTQVRGDIGHGSELREALTGCDGVFHLAGFVSRDPKDTQRMMRTHVDGTRRLMEAASEAKVRRVVLSSTSGTVAVSETEKIHTEDSGYATEVVAGWPYYASKIYQEKLAFQFGQELGIEVVSVNPSLLLGPGDRRLSSTTDVLRFLRKQIPVVPKGGVSLVDVRDAARATVVAMEKGRSGERYLLGGPNWTFEEFLGRLSRAADIGAPRLRLPQRWQRVGASIMEEVYRFQGKEPPLDRISVEMSQHFWWLDSTKAKRELGFTTLEPSLTLGDTISYLRQNIAPDV